MGVVTTGEVAGKSAIPPWVLLIGALGIVAGLATFGHRVMATIGRRITELTPSRREHDEAGEGAEPEQLDEEDGQAHFLEAARHGEDAA